MTALKEAIQQALATEGDLKDSNKAYLEFIKANFIIPLEMHSQEDAPQVLFLTEAEKTYLPVFTEMCYLDNWASEIKDTIKILRLSGLDLLKGLADEVTVCLDLGNPHYKAFHPEETARMRSMVLKLFKK